MKRYVFAAAIICLCVSVYARIENTAVLLALFAINSLILGTVCCLNGKNARLAVICLALSCLFIARTVNTVQKIKTFDDLSGKRVYISAVVCESFDTQKANFNRNCVLKVIKSSNENIKKGDNFLYYYNSPEKLKLGTKIQGEFIMGSLKNSVVAHSYYSNGVYAYLKEQNIRVSQSGFFQYEFINTVQEIIKQELLNKTDNSGILIAMLYGERAYISETFDNAVKVCGVSHVLVVSGLHFSVLCGFVFVILRIFRIKSIFKDIIVLFAVLLYICICSFSVSVLRAATAFVMLVLYKYTNRIRNGIVALCNAVFVILFIHPFAALSISFQLSFAATFGILVIYPEISNYIHKRVKDKIAAFLLKNAAVTFSAFIATLPFCVYHFGWVSVISVPVNLIIGFIVSPMLICSAVAVVAVFVKASFVSAAMFWLCDALADCFRKIIKYAASTGVTVVALKNKEILVAVLMLSYFLVYELYTCKCRIGLLKLYKRLKKEE